MTIEMARKIMDVENIKIDICRALKSPDEWISPTWSEIVKDAESFISGWGARENTGELFHASAN